MLGAGLLEEGGALGGGELGGAMEKLFDQAPAPGGVGLGLAGVRLAGIEDEGRVGHERPVVLRVTPIAGEGKEFCWSRLEECG